jgi:Sulfotransferase domain
MALVQRQSSPPSSQDRRRKIGEKRSYEASPDGAKSSVSAAPQVNRLPMKIFQIGFNKCGTSTIHHYLSANGIRSLHWDKGRLARRIFTNLANGDELLAGYEEFDAFTDMEFLDGSGTYLEAYKLFPYLAAHYPDAVFILNTRDPEAWIRSRLTHGIRPYAKRHMIYYDVTSTEQLAELWRAEWERHHRRVTEFFRGKPHRFFVCRIETDLPHLLSEMIPECKLDPSHYELRKVTKSRPRPSYLRRLIKQMRRR